LIEGSAGRAREGAAVTTIARASELVIGKIVITVQNVGFDAVIIVLVKREVTRQIRILHIILVVLSCHMGS
jgi:hypothetical protein